MKPFRLLLHKTAVVLAAVSLLALLITGNAFADDDNQFVGRVYVLTNQLTGNTVVVLGRNANGTLTRLQEVSTGGLGSGPGPRPPAFGTGPGPDALNSADAITMTEDGRFLLATNAGSNELSVMAVTNDGLTLVDKVSSDGQFPISVTANGNLVYVLNQRGTPNITGFRMDFNGRVHEIRNSVQTVGASGSAPGEVKFTPDGELLIVAETLANFVDLFKVDENGLVRDRVRFPSNNRTPLAVAFGHHHVLALTEGDMLGPQQGIPGGSSLSTYRITDDDTLEPISKAVPNGQTATCWTRFSKNGHYVFTGNTGSGTISAYSVTPQGDLSLLAAVAANTGGPASVPLDLDVTRDGKYLYGISSLIGRVMGWRIEEDGTLTPVDSVEGFPLTIQGIVAR
jgi:6-phosphogluconolactonase